MGDQGAELKLYKIGWRMLYLHKASWKWKVCFSSNALSHSTDAAFPTLLDNFWIKFFVNHANFSYHFHLEKLCCIHLGQLISKKLFLELQEILFKVISFEVILCCNQAEAIV